MAVLGSQIHFVCRAKHAKATAVSKTSALETPITLNEGLWAYCSHAAPAEHIWEAIEPVSLADLKLAEVATPARPRGRPADGGAAV